MWAMGTVSKRPWDVHSASQRPQTVVDQVRTEREDHIGLSIDIPFSIQGMWEGPPANTLVSYSLFCAELLIPESNAAAGANVHDVQITAVVVPNDFIAP